MSASQQPEHLISERKFAVIPAASIVVSSSGFRLGLKASEMNGFPIYLNTSTPPATDNGGDPLELTASSLGAVPRILSSSTNPKVRSSVVESISVYVVYGAGSGRVGYPAVQRLVDSGSGSYGPFDVDVLAANVRVPGMILDHRRIFCGHEGHKRLRRCGECVVATLANATVSRWFSIHG